MSVTAQDLTTKERLQSIEVGRMMDIQRGLHTETVTRIKEDRFAIDNTVGERVTTYNDLETTRQYIDGEIDSFDLDWD